MGIAKLLLAHNYPVMTVSAGRSQHTVDRIRSARIKDVALDEDLLAEVDIILSIVPPRDALATGKRFADTRKAAAASRRDKKGATAKDVLYIDLNAVSPKTVAKIDALFTANAKPPSPPPSTSLAHRLTRSLSITSRNHDDTSSDPPPPPPVTIKMLDGGIIGSPPSREKDKSDDEAADGANSTELAWKKPSIPLSGPHKDLLSADLQSTLNMKFVSEKIGTASALKACFASLSKGFTALSILSYTTAATCGVLPELQEHLDLIVPDLRQRAEKSMTAMPPKAYRWADEMREIGQTFKSSGGMSFGGKLFNEVGELYRFVAEDTLLGGERVGKRKRGMSVEDVTEAMEEGVQKKMQKGEGRNEKLELAWRGSWGL